jgi:hypothetical protein
MKKICFHAILLYVHNFNALFVLSREHRKRKIWWFMAETFILSIDFFLLHTHPLRWIFLSYALLQTQQRKDFFLLATIFSYPFYFSLRSKCVFWSEGCYKSFSKRIFCVLIYRNAFYNRPDVFSSSHPPTFPLMSISWLISFFCVRVCECLCAVIES